MYKSAVRFILFVLFLILGDGKELHAIRVERIYAKAACREPGLWVQTRNSRFVAQLKLCPFILCFTIAEKHYFLPSVFHFQEIRSSFYHALRLNGTTIQQEMARLVFCFYVNLLLDCVS